MKIRTEICGEGEEEIVIRCSKETPEIARLENGIKRLISEEGNMQVNLGDRKFLLSFGEILFFETGDGKTTVHTNGGMYYTGLKLFELESLLPGTFARASKSTIVNIARIRSIKRNITGPSEVTFRRSEKITYISRSYYKSFTDKIEEVRK
ncbi:MAG: LytTR family transcriptional regulator DNA-binding domain-containing protein [Clostridia bacterium]|nr:LytTR family transcriptional regulator DNA-binding domain-containing protein [Clostridia bacterium]